MKVLFGFDNQKVIKDVVAFMESKNFPCDYEIAKTKIDVFLAAAEDEELDTVVLCQKVENESDWTAVEIARLNDARTLNIVVLLENSLKGTQFSKILYSAGVRGVIFGDANAELIADLIMNKRTDSEALRCFGFKDMEWKDRLDNVIKVKDITMDLKSVSGFELDKIKEKINASENQSNAFDYVCMGLNDEQIQNLDKKLNNEEKRSIKKSTVLKNLNAKKSKDTSYYKMPDIQRFDDKSRNILFGFKNEEVVNKIESILTEEGYNINYAIKYSKREIVNSLKTDPTIDTIVVIENLEMRGGYSRYELGELVKDRDINLIVLLDASRKGTDYVSYLYSCGVTSIVFNPARTTDIIELIKKPRNRQDARTFYGITLGRLNEMVLCDEYVNSICYYLDNGKGSFGFRYDNVKGFVDKRQMATIRQCCTEDVIKKIDDADGAKKRRKRPIKEGKINKPVGIKDNVKDSKSLAKNNNEKATKKREKSDNKVEIIQLLNSLPKKYMIGFALCFILLIWGVGSIIAKSSIHGQIETVYTGDDAIYVDGVGVETTVAEESVTVETTTIAQTTIAPTTIKETTVEETTKKKKKKKKKETATTKKSINNSSNYNSNSSNNSSSSKQQETKAKKEKVEDWNSNKEKIEDWDDEKLD